MDDKLWIMDGVYYAKYPLIKKWSDASGYKHWYK
jgi:hypothetical protein